MDVKIKKRAVKHIIYETGMFAFTFKELKKTEIEEELRNALIESLVIHAYNLYRFLYQGEVEKKKGNRNKRKPTDVIAEDYIEKGRRLFFRHNRTPKRYFRNLENKRNKQIAHLTYDRITKKGWNIKMFTRLWHSVGIFLKSLPEDVNKKWFGEEIQKARKNVKSY